jgi:radical SAM superfamily enzyme YgiQ (UPF0313 family)
MMMKSFRVMLVYANKMMENLIPINMSALAAVLKERGFEVKLFDTTYYRTEEGDGDQVRVDNLQIRGFDLSKYGVRYKETDVHSDFRAAVKDYRPGIIGLSVVEDTYKTGISLLERIRDLDIPTIAGGVHTVLSPEEVIAEDSVDMVCTGEGENALVNLCERMRRREDYTATRGIWFKKDGRVIKNEGEDLTDISALPYLDFTIYEKERFYRAMQGVVYRMLPVETSRGCPYACTYCSAARLKEIYRSRGIYYRRKSVERIIDEVKFYKGRYDLNYVYFTSESFLSMSDEEFSRFVSLYKDIRLPFWCQTRPETIREDRIKMLEDINCERMTVGIECGDESIRRNLLNRHVSNETILKAFDILGRSSIPVSVNNIIGLPDETRDNVFDTIRLNRLIKADAISVFVFTPFRGTRLRQYCVEKGYIPPDVYSGDNRKRSVLTMPTLSQDEIRGLLRTFPLYVKFPPEDYKTIELAERFDEKGNAAFRRLSERYKKEYFK